MKTLRYLLFLLPLVPSVGLAQSRISVNYEGGQLNPALMGPGTAQVTGTAGIVPVANWNNFPDWSGTDEALVDHNGAVTSATLTYAVQNNWAATNTAPGDGGNGDLMSGQLDNLQNSDAGGIPNFITVSNLGPEFTANGYDVYVYQNADSGGAAAGFIMDGATTIYLLQVGGAGANYPLLDPGNVDGFIVSTETDPGMVTSSNVVLFENMTGATFTITGAPGGGGARPRPNGLQIVARSEIIDNDNDGLDDGWEVDNMLDPTDDGSVDIVNGPDGDPDLDTLSNLEEFNGGTDPRDADTDDDGLDDNVEDRTGIFVDATMTGTNPLIDDSDGDSILDGDEVNGDPFDSDPNNADTDGDGLSDDSELDPNPFVTDPGDEDTDNDGFSDSTEINLGSDPTDGGDTPEVGGGTSIGINFNSNRQTTAELGPDEIAGFPDVAQLNWNNSGGGADAAAGANGTEADIISPAAGSLVDDSGGVVATTVTWTSNGTWNTTNGEGTPDAKLMNGYIDAINAGGFTTIDFVGIPYPEYDVYVYFGSDGNGRTGEVESTTAGQIFSYSTFSNDPNGGGGFDAANDYVLTDVDTGNPNANYCVFAEQTAADFSLHINRGSSNSGIHGVQVVGTGPGVPVEICDIEYDPTTGLVRLTSNLRPVEYLLEVSTDGGVSFLELTDGIQGGLGIVTQEFAPGFVPGEPTPTILYRFKEAPQ